MCGFTTACLVSGRGEVAGARLKESVSEGAGGRGAGRRLHVLTKHRVFSGPGFLMAQEVGDITHGGQVALTHDAWLELRHGMDRASAPPPPSAAARLHSSGRLDSSCGLRCLAASLLLLLLLLLLH